MKYVRSLHIDGKVSVDSSETDETLESTSSAMITAPNGDCVVDRNPKTGCTGISCTVAVGA